MKILALFGKGNIGKSTTLKILTAKLMENFNTVVLEFERGESSAEAIYERIQARNEAKRAGRIYRGYDTSTVLSINGFNIGITTHGDLSKEIKKKVSKFKEQDCALAICAMHMTENSKKALKECAIGDSITMIGHTEFQVMNGNTDLTEQQNKLNEKMADLLKQYVDEIVNK